MFPTMQLLCIPQSISGCIHANKHSNFDLRVETGRSKKHGEVTIPSLTCVLETVQTTRPTTKNVTRAQTISCRSTAHEGVHVCESVAKWQNIFLLLTT